MKTCGSIDGVNNAVHTDMSQFTIPTDQLPCLLMFMLYCTWKLVGRITLHFG